MYKIFVALRSINIDWNFHEYYLFETSWQLWTQNVVVHWVHEVLRCMMFADDAVLVDEKRWADVLYGEFKRQREKWIENKSG